VPCRFAQPQTLYHMGDGFVNMENLFSGPESLHEIKKVFYKALFFVYDGSSYRHSPKRGDDNG
jgi:hypothetical protein